jgi:hypothetical protein
MEGGFGVSVGVKRSERNETLTTTADIPKNGRVSYVDHPAFLSCGEALADDWHAGQATS